MAATIVLIVIAFVLFAFAASGIKIVRPYQKGIVEQLGSCNLQTLGGCKLQTLGGCKYPTLAGYK